MVRFQPIIAQSRICQGAEPAILAKSYGMWRLAGLKMFGEFQDLHSVRSGGGVDEAAVAF